VSLIVDPEEVERERQKAAHEEQLVLDLIGGCFSQSGDSGTFSSGQIVLYFQLHPVGI